MRHISWLHGRKGQFQAMLVSYYDYFKWKSLPAFACLSRITHDMYMCNVCIFVIVQTTLLWFFLMEHAYSTFPTSLWRRLTQKWVKPLLQPLWCRAQLQNVQPGVMSSSSSKFLFYTCCWCVGGDERNTTTCGIEKSPNEVVHYGCYSSGLIE